MTNPSGSPVPRQRPDDDGMPRWVKVVGAVVLVVVLLLVVLFVTRGPGGGGHGPGRHALPTSVTEPVEQRL